ncbi:hypothetical protein [Microbispora rosea]|uniref:hypothetical protein n=1 Tax=Microbispora rosea TaxID=58117 RepID=UPI0034209D93
MDVLPGLERAINNGSIRIATRKLCAAVLVNPAARDRALYEVYDNRLRRVAPSYGFDLIPVLVYARRAFALAIVNDFLIMATVVASAIHAPLAMIFVTSVFASWYVLRNAARLVMDYIRYIRDRKSFSELEQLKARRKLLGYLAPPSFAIAVLSTLAVGSGFGREFGGLKESLFFLGCLLAVSVLITAVRQAMLEEVRRAPKGLYPEKRLAKLNPRLREIDRQQKHPFTVHSGYRPFVGSGRSLTEWSFAQRLIKKQTLMAEDAGKEFEKRPFGTRDLVAYLEERITNLADESDPETRLNGLTVKHRIFVEGVNAKQYLAELLGEPDRHRLEQIMADPSAVGRHYLTCQVESWGGEIVTTVYVHVSLQGRTLYLQFCACALPPTPRDYQFIEEAGRIQIIDFMRAVLVHLIDVPELIRAPRRILSLPRRLVAAIFNRTDRASALRRGRDVGAEMSLREPDEAEDDELARLLRSEEELEESYFQLADIRKHTKIIERQLIAAVTDFLSAHDVDTSEFEARVTAILNQGVINTGSGTVNANGSAIGSQNVIVTGSSSSGDG